MVSDNPPVELIDHCSERGVIEKREGDDEGSLRTVDLQDILEEEKEVEVSGRREGRGEGRRGG